MKESNKVIFELILETRSLTAIRYNLESYIADEDDAEDEDDRPIMEKIMGLNALDPIYILCHQQIAAWHLHKAKELQDFIDKKRGR